MCLSNYCDDGVVVQQNALPYEVRTLHDTLPSSPVSFHLNTMWAKRRKYDENTNRKRYYPVSGTSVLSKKQKARLLGITTTAENVPYHCVYLMLNLDFCMMYHLMHFLYEANWIKYKYTTNTWNYKQWFFAIILYPACKSLHNDFLVLQILMNLYFAKFCIWHHSPISEWMEKHSSVSISAAVATASHLCSTTRIYHSLYKKRTEVMAHCFLIWLSYWNIPIPCKNVYLNNMKMQANTTIYTAKFILNTCYNIVHLPNAQILFTDLLHLQN